MECKWPTPLPTQLLSSLSDAKVLLDTDGRAMAALVGRPRGDPTWGPSAARASAALTNTRTEGLARGAFRAADLDHRRGIFLAVASGVSFGGGQKVGAVFFRHTHNLLTAP